MTKKELALLQEIMNGIEGLNDKLGDLETRVSKLESGKTTVSKTSAKSAKATAKTKTSGKKSAPAKTATKSSKTSLADFEPKKDKDGFYNWASYKACRRRYVEEVSGKTLHGKDGEWLEGATFKKYAAAFEKKFQYIKKADR